MWFQLKIEHCPTQEIEQISEELEELGVLSLTYTDKNDNPVLEPEPGTTPLWPEIIIQALFAEDNEVQKARTQLAQTRPFLAFDTEIIPDKDWQRAWMDDFKPQHFGKQLWVCPTWLTPPDANAINIMLDPGLAFGTGNHATTGLCLTWLEHASLDDKSIIDYGCGSGILSLAALKLGAKHVYAVDIEQQALEATHNNAQTNLIDENTLSVCLPEKLEQPVDLIIANILLEPLLFLKHRFHQLLKTNSLLVISGILKEQVALLKETYLADFDFVTEENNDNWALLVFSKK